MEPTKPTTIDEYHARHDPARIPADTRPYRSASQPGDELTLTGYGNRHGFRHIGWHGQSGAFYSLGEDPSKHEPGSFTPLWLPIGSEPIEEPDTDEILDEDLEILSMAGRILGSMLGRWEAATAAFNASFRNGRHDEGLGREVRDEEFHAEPEGKRPTVVVLCGSTRFSEAFQQANLTETLAGRIVLSIGCDMRTDTDLFAGMDPGDLAIVKTNLDELHKRKIDLADEVLVLNVGGYIGDSTRSEISYAQKLGKPIRWLEPSTEANRLLDEIARPAERCRCRVDEHSDLELWTHTLSCQIKNGHTPDCPPSCSGHDGPPAQLAPCVDPWCGNSHQSLTDKPHAFVAMPASSIGSCAVCHRPQSHSNHGPRAEHDEPDDLDRASDNLLADTSDPFAHCHKHVGGGYCHRPNGHDDDCSTKGDHTVHTEQIEGAQQK